MSSNEDSELDFKRLNEAVLRPGDLVLTTTTAAVSAAIRAATRSDISHAMVYVEDRSVIDATDEGVHARNTQRMLIEASCPVHVLRLKGGISTEQLNAIRAYLRSHIGTRYSKKEAVLAGLGGSSRWTRQQFCSRLVAQAFDSAGIALVPDPNYCSPAELKASPRLEIIANATLPVTPEEAAMWDDRTDVPQMMRDAINMLLRGARSMNSGIETFEDLNAYLVANPDHDDNLCHLLNTSGYLELWQIEKSKNPWQYDLALLDAAPADEIVEYCWNVLANKVGGPNRYIVNRGAYSLLARQHDRRFFQEMAGLYEHLAGLHRQRVEVATRWLDARGNLQIDPHPPLTPHSDAWFGALEHWDPAQAMMTRQILRMAGHADVCSVCGDDPSLDYRLPEDHRAAGGVDTLRLCDDCLHIRRGQGEPFVALPPAGNGGASGMT